MNISRNTSRHKVEVLISRKKRRRWTTQAKLAILEKSDQPGARSAVAREHEIPPSQVFSTSFYKTLSEIKK